MIVQNTVPDRSMDAQASDDLDWDALYADLAPRVFNYFRYRLGRESDVEDLTARTFEKAWRARTNYRRDLAGFSTWLFKIAQNVGADYVNTWRSHLPLEAATDVTTGETPASHAELDSDLARLAALTATLPARERELIALKYGASLNNRLIAELTGLSESNVGTLLHRLVKTLRAQWYGADVSIRDE
jgi:RNA polymerase sigma-70 factor, ECF subfamily